MQTLVNQDRWGKLQMEAAVKLSQRMKFQLLESAALALGNAPDCGQQNNRIVPDFFTYFAGC